MVALRLFRKQDLALLMSGGLRLILHSGLGIIGRLLTYENYAMELKKEYTDNYDWYLYNLSIKKDAQGKRKRKKGFCTWYQYGNSLWNSSRR